MVSTAKFNCSDIGAVNGKLSPIVLGNRLVDENDRSCACGRGVVG